MGQGPFGGGRRRNVAAAAYAEVLSSLPGPGNSCRRPIGDQGTYREIRTILLRAQS